MLYGTGWRRISMRRPTSLAESLLVHENSRKRKPKFRGPTKTVVRAVAPSRQYPAAGWRRELKIGVGGVLPHGPCAKADGDAAVAKALNRSMTWARRLRVNSGGPGAAGLAALGGIHATIPDCLRTYSGAHRWPDRSSGNGFLH